MHKENPIDSSPIALHNYKVVYLQMMLILPLVVYICHLQALFGHVNAILEQLCGFLK
jgi:hypothetical protein